MSRRYVSLAHVKKNYYIVPHSIDRFSINVELSVIVYLRMATVSKNTVIIKYLDKTVLKQGTHQVYFSNKSLPALYIWQYPIHFD